MGIRVAADNVFLKNCDVSGFHDGIHLGKNAAASFENINLMKVHSHDNTRDGLDVRSSLVDVTVANSQFNDNTADGFDGAGTNGVTLTNLVVTSVEANRNSNDGFELQSIVNGVFVDVTANGNQRDGMNFLATNGPLSIQDYTFCNNGKDFDGASTFSGFTDFAHHSITCNIQDIGTDNLCDCSCPEIPV